MRESLLVVLLAISVVYGNLGVFSDRIYAQMDEQTEQQDEGKRDFAAHGEIDYTKINLLENQRVVSEKLAMERFIDYDSYRNKMVYTANIALDGLKREIFVVDTEKKVKNGKAIVSTITETQKRLTWDSERDCVANLHPFWTKNREIGYAQVNLSTKKNHFYLINEDGSSRKEISRRKYDKLFWASHNKDSMSMVDVPPQ